MAFDGSTWNEASPTNADLANEIDDNMRDIKQGISGRMRHEHVWPASQAATASGGHHSFISFQAQTNPGVAGTTGGAVFVDTDKALKFVDSAGGVFLLAASAKGVTFAGGTGTVGQVPVVTSGGGMVLSTGGADGSVLMSKGSTGIPVWTNGASAFFGVGSGLVTSGGTIPLLSGFASNQVTCFVSLHKIGTASGGDGDNISYHECSVDANRLVACRAYIRTGLYIAGTANYLTIGTK
jgi:hypothetical protein